MNKNRVLGDDNLIGGLALIGAGLSWLWGAFLPGLLIGLGLGLIVSALRQKEAGDGAVVETKPASAADESKTGEAAQLPPAKAAEVGESEVSESRENANIPDIDVVWARILAHQGQVFHQSLGQAFTYEVSGNALIPSTVKAKIYKSQFAKALAKVPFDKVSDVPAGVFGPSYVYAILMDRRIRQDDW